MIVENTVEYAKPQLHITSVISRCRDHTTWAILLANLAFAFLSGKERLLSLWANDLSKFLADLQKGETRENRRGESDVKRRRDFEVFIWNGLQWIRVLKDNVHEGSRNQSHLTRTSPPTHPYPLLPIVSQVCSCMAQSTLYVWRHLSHFFTDVNLVSFVADLDTKTFFQDMYEEFEVRGSELHPL